MLLLLLVLQLLYPHFHRTNAYHMRRSPHPTHNVHSTATACTIHAVPLTELAIHMKTSTILTTGTARHHIYSSHNMSQYLYYNICRSPIVFAMYIKRRSSHYLPNNPHTVCPHAQSLVCPHAQSLVCPMYRPHSWLRGSSQCYGINLVPYCSFTDR